MADHENEQEHEHEHELVEEAPIEKVDIDPSTLTPTSPEVICKYGIPTIRKNYMLTTTDKQR